MTRDIRKSIRQNDFTALSWSSRGKVMIKRTISTSKIMKSKLFIYSSPFQGAPKLTNFQLIEEELPPLQDGEFLAEAIFISVDPYMRRYAGGLPVGSIFTGSQVAKILESKNSKYPPGKYVFGEFGWRNYTLSNGKTEGIFPNPYVLPDFGNLPLSLALGILGMPGNTAYFGFLDICRPKACDIVVISGAAGGVGSHVGQIAKIKNCTVVGIAGSEEKGKWLLELGFDYFINYKTDNVEEKLKNIAPDGIDCYFDNVGGKISSMVLKQLNKNARVCICGSIAGYNTEKDGIIELPMLRFPYKLERFLVVSPNYLNLWMEGIQENLKWVQEGKITYRETVTEGLENTPKAFIELFEGRNIGKAIVKI